MFAKGVSILSDWDMMEHSLPELNREEQDTVLMNGYKLLLSLQSTES